jgi:hypothetical protein
MHYSAIPGPGNEATWSAYPAGFDGDNPWEADARDHLLACPDDWLQWVAESNDFPGEGRAIGVEYVGEDVSRCSVPTLLAVMLAGDSEQCLRARHELRERFVAARSEQIADIAEEMLRAEAASYDEPGVEF